MTFTESIQTCFRKYAHFEGRATRSEYWWFYLFCILFQALFQILGSMVGGMEGGDLLSGLASLIIVVPSIAVATRRLHDTNKSGWRQLWVLTIIGIIPLIIWLATEGDSKENRFGNLEA